MEEKRELLVKILSKAKDVQSSDYGFIKSFSIELVEKDNDQEDSILFNSLHEAVEIISEFAGKHLKEEITQDILSYISISELLENPSFRLKIFVS